ncbi:ABC transporter substrate-binding protein [Salipiger mangrovisoli]|uniref:ABC transporter substrate-binding protein n=1 Tax=Salipiger mangrovisoli TaxID=2865933 RepID=A0ABR9X304_9RHOB|nr:ABC transporter substrate-binding protein [Salipiger mangrovisoli]MBE9637965.1 ABC transporter substrate-binding protein [Salipiger mangrovisoli]
MQFSPLLAASALALGAAAGAQAATPDSALVMAYNIDAISSFDPAQIAEVVTDEIIMNACDALVDYDPENEAEFVPSLAESWDVSEDGQTVTFHLRDGIVYPDGTPGSAGDLVWSMKRVVELGFGNSASLTEYGFTQDTIDRLISAPDDRTVVMQLDKPYPVNLLLASIAANRVSVMLNRSEVEAHETDGDRGNAYLQDKSACVGPYSVAQWNPSESVLLQANETYTGPNTPNLPRVLIRHVAEPGTQRLLLEKGDVDVARNLTAEDLDALESQDGVDVVRTLVPSLFYMGMNVTKPPFDDPKVRLAMRHLIDYQGLADSVMKGVGVPRASFVQLGAFGALDEKEGQPFKVDVEKAKALLAEAGFPEGFEVSLIIGSHPYGNPIAQSVQETASKAGVTFKIERMANAQLYARNRARDFDAALLGFKTNVPDANGMASRLVMNPDNALEAKLTQYPAWRSGYQDEEMNARVEAALFERDPELRARMYHALQQDIMQQGPMAYIMQTMSAAGKRDSLHDWTWNGFRIYYGKATK